MSRRGSEKECWFVIRTGNFYKDYEVWKRRPFNHGRPLHAGVGTSNGMPKIARGCAFSRGGARPASCSLYEILRRHALIVFG
jgi:hypothetical protein